MLQTVNGQMVGDFDVTTDDKDFEFVYHKYQVSFFSVLFEKFIKRLGLLFFRFRTCAKNHSRGILGEKDFCGKDLVTQT